MNAKNLNTIVQKAHAKRILTKTEKMDAKGYECKETCLICGSSRTYWEIDIDDNEFIPLVPLKHTSDCLYKKWLNEAKVVKVQEIENRDLRESHGIPN